MQTAVKRLPLVLLLEYRMKKSSVFIVLTLYLFTDWLSYQKSSTIYYLFIVMYWSVSFRVILNHPWWLFLPGRKGSAPPSVLAPKGDIGYFGMPGINGPPGKPGPLGKVFLLLTSFSFISMTALHIMVFFQVLLILFISSVLFVYTYIFHPVSELNAQ